MKLLHITLLSVFVFLLFTGIGLIVWWNQNTKSVSSDNKPVRIVITKGNSASEVGNELYKKGLIKSSLAFKLYVRLTGKASSIQAGEFELSPNLTLSQAVDKLSSGPLQLWVTIPEGLRKEEIAQKIIDGLRLEEGKPAGTFSFIFLDLVKDAKAEGYLFPDTYLFPRDVNPKTVLSTLKNTFDKRVDEKMRDDITKSGRTLEEIVILASILEKETRDKDKEERSIVAGILWKRLGNGWPLQADATVQYALASMRCGDNLDCEWWPKNLTTEDLEIVSSYNTYKNSTMPPTPISNPGLSTITAAIYPQESDYWYYIHDNEGKIHYAKTLEEHNSNVNQYLR